MNDKSPPPPTYGAVTGQDGPPPTSAPYPPQQPGQAYPPQPGQAYPPGPGQAYPPPPPGGAQPPSAYPQPGQPGGPVPQEPPPMYEPPKDGQYPQQGPYPPQQGYPPMQPGYQTTVVTQPVGTVIVQNVRYGPGPCTTTCPHCQALITTQVTYQAGGLTWLAAALICFFGGFVCCCCLIPFCINDLKDAKHSCPECDKQIGIHRKL